jgi:ribosomal RNA methyltransferase Nop2
MPAKGSRKRVLPLDGDGDAEELPIERKSKKLIAKSKEDEYVVFYCLYFYLHFRKLAEEELHLNIKTSAKFDLPSLEQAEEDVKNPTDIGSLKEQIQEIIQVLGDFKERRLDNRPRSDYLHILKLNLNAYYGGYNDFLMDKFMKLFPNPTEVFRLNMHYNLIIFS